MGVVSCFNRILGHFHPREKSHTPKNLQNKVRPKKLLRKKQSFTNHFLNSVKEINNLECVLFFVRLSIIDVTNIVLRLLVTSRIDQTKYIENIEGGGGR